MPSLWPKIILLLSLKSRGFGDSSKPITGYDGKTTAEDIYQLVSQLDFNNQPIFLVAHDVGAQTSLFHTLLLILIM